MGQKADTEGFKHDISHKNGAAANKAVARPRIFAENISLIVPPEFLHTILVSQANPRVKLWRLDRTYARGEDPNAPARKRKTIRAPMFGEAAATAFQSVNMI